MLLIKPQFCLVFTDDKLFYQAEAQLNNKITWLENNSHYYWLITTQNMHLNVNNFK